MLRRIIVISAVGVLAVPASAAAAQPQHLKFEDMPGKSVVISHRDGRTVAAALFGPVSQRSPVKLVYTQKRGVLKGRFVVCFPIGQIDGTIKGKYRKAADGSVRYSGALRIKGGSEAMTSSKGTGSITGKRQAGDRVTNWKVSVDMRYTPKPDDSNGDGGFTLEGASWKSAVVDIPDGHAFSAGIADMRDLPQNPLRGNHTVEGNRIDGETVICTPMGKVFIEATSHYTIDSKGTAHFSGTWHTTHGTFRLKNLNERGTVTGTQRKGSRIASFKLRVAN
jgi:hypothetical protein